LEIRIRKIIICCFILASNLLFCQKKVSVCGTKKFPKTESKSVENQTNSKKLQKAIGNLLKGNNQTTSNGILNSNNNSIEGEIRSGSGSGNGIGYGYGKGNVSAYSLNERKPINKPQPNFNCCNEYGTVVVKITIDKNGTAIDASPGYRGTTNSNSCLMSEAKKAALQTKWEPSPSGTEIQVGTIIYKFNPKD
jgi:outer membrane biosynthesis protein TonB